MTYSTDYRQSGLIRQDSKKAPANVLVIGFSVTEMPNSYFPIARKILCNNGSDVNIIQCGIGGITPESLVYIIDDVLSRHMDCEVVIFEIATSYVRDVYAAHIAYNEVYKREIWSQIEKLILSAKSKGMKPAFFNLPRKDVNYLDDMLEGIISKVSHSYGIRVLSISNEFVINNISADDLFLDEVHPGPFLANFYAEKLANFVPLVLNGETSIPYDGLARYNSLDISKYSDESSVQFNRHGFSANSVILNEGEDLCIDFRNEFSFEGFAVLCGPRSGRLYIETDQTFDFLCYDEFCYYERVMTCVKPLGTSRKVTFRLAPEIPTIPLRKGTPSKEKRSMGLLYLFTK